MEDKRTPGLEPLGGILQGQGENHSNPSNRAPTRHYQRETRTEELTCQTCNKTFEGEVAIYKILGETTEIPTRECPECRQARQVRDEQLAQEELQLQREKIRMRWRMSCGIPAYLWEKTFGNFDKRFQRSVANAAERWAEAFSEKAIVGHPSLILYSDEFGVGKTHLAVAIANHIIESWNGDPMSSVCPVRFESGPGLVRRVRATYNIRDDDIWHETEEMVYNQLRGVKLLILDDVGKERPSAHTREVYFYIIDERLKSGLPVVITSNLPLEGEGSLEQLMGEATVSRLIGMCQGNYYKIKGEDMRRRNKRP